MSNKVPLKTKAAIFAAAFLSFVCVLVETSMNVTFPEMSQVFHEPLSIIQWITTGYLLFTCVMMSASGYLMKRFNVKPLFFCACTAFVVGDLMCSFAPNFWILLIGRLIQAGATGISFPMMYQIIFTQVPRAKVGFYSGLAAMVISLAPALGPTYGGIMSSLLSWRYIFIVAIPLLLIDLVIGFFTIDQKASGTKKKFSFTSLVLLAISLFSIIFGVNQIGVKNSSWLTIAGPILLSIVTLILFLYTNSHGNSELLSFSALKVPDVVMSMSNYGILQFINIGISFVLPIYMETVLHSSPLVAGLVLLPGSLLGGFVSPTAGWIYDRIGAFIPIIFGLSVLTITMFFFSVLTAFFTPLLFMILFCFLRLGFNSAFGNSLTSAQQADQAETADVNGLFNMTQQFAGSLGTTILAVVISFGQNQSTGKTSFINHTMLGGHIDFIILFALAALALVMTLANLFRHSKKYDKITKS